MWWILVEIKYKFRQVALPIYKFINDVKHFKGFYFCFYSEVYSTFVTIICPSAIHLLTWIDGVASYNSGTIYFMWSSILESSTRCLIPLYGRKFKIRFFNPLILFKEMKYYLCLIWTLPENNYTFDFWLNKMNCELMLTYDTPSLWQTGSRNLTGQKTLPTIWQNIGSLPSIVAEKNVTKNVHICSMCIETN